MKDTASDRAVARDGWPALSIFAWGGAIALVMSSEFLAQPFIWRSWGLGDIALGWAVILGDRLIVAGAIAACIVLAERAQTRSAILRAVLFGAAVLAGAAAGEGLRGLIDPLGDRLDLPAVIGRILAWTLAASAVGGILAAWRHSEAAAATAQAAQIRAAQMRQLTTATQLEALQRQIEPHFLFNTLATIKRLGVTSPIEGRRLLSLFLEFTSATLATGVDAETTLGQELDLAKAYLDVCAARMGTRLKVVWEIEPGCRDRRFPALMLGTLLENALKHGLAPMAAGGVITISARVEGRVMEVAVSDTGAGVTAQGGVGIGLANLTARLRLLYSARARFSLEPRPGGGVRATIAIPDDLAVR